jgi:hypothetical protein
VDAGIEWQRQRGSCDGARCERGVDDTHAFLEGSDDILAWR